jgi:hypothetical protein
VLVLVAVAPAGCGAKDNAATTTVNVNTGHAAPDLEALLPDDIDGTPLRKGSTTGAVVFGGNAFGDVLKRFLAKHEKTPDDLRFANAQASRRELELGVFEVRGLAASALRRAIVSGSRPNAPGLAVSQSALADKRVTKLVYPGGTTLYLYDHGELVYYVGTQDESLAGQVMERFP